MGDTTNVLCVRVARRVVSVACFAVLGACASGAAPAPTLAAPPTRTSVADPGMRRFLIDGAAGQACTRTKDRFVGLPSSEDANLPGEQAGLARITGRWLIQNCLEQPSPDGEGLTMGLGGPGWIWIDQTKLGFRIRQYVYFYASATVTGRLDLAYDEPSRVASIWVTPTYQPAVSFTPSAIDAQPQNPITSFLGAVAPTSVANHTREKAEEQGRERFGEALRKGLTITYSTATNQLDMLVGALASGAVPKRPFNAPRWFANERQELHPGGVQMAGPFPFAPNAILDAYIESGADLEYAAVCSGVAQSVVAQITGQGPIAPPVAFSSIGPGAPVVTRLNPPPCDWTLLTLSRSETTASVLVAPQMP